MSGTGSTVGYGSTPAPGTTINFGNVNVGSTSTSPLVINETGTAALDVSSFVFNGGTSGDFSLTGATFPFTIANGGSAVNLSVRCTPSAMGTRSTVLQITTNVGVQSYPLICVGAQAGYGSTPAAGNELNFGTILTAGSVTGQRTLQVRETGNATLNVTSITITGPNASDFSVTPPTTFSITDGGAVRDVAVVCNPSADGQRTATLNVNTNAGNVTYPLVCTGGTPGYGSTPAPNSTIIVGDLQVGSSTSINLTVRETGNAPLTVNSASLTGSHPGDFSATVVGGFPFTINDGGNSQVVRIGCAPTANGERTATLTFSTNVGARTYTLTCTGRAPGYQSSPPPASTLDIKIPFDQSSRTASIVINNIGSADITITPSALGTLPAQITLPNTTPFVVPVGGTGQVDIACTASAAGGFEVTGQVQIDYGAPTRATYNIICRRPAGPPLYDSTPAVGPISMGSTDVGTSIQQLLTVRETGADTLVISTTEIIGIHRDDFSLTRSQGFPFSINDGGAAQDLQLRCAPLGLGLREATLTIRTNVGDQVYPLSCTGTGAGLDSAPSPGSTVFVGTIEAGTGTVQFTLPVTNTGTASLQVNEAELTGSGRDDFAIRSPSQTGSPPQYSRQL
ncbi:MAG: choice-of-anchor D domain-containing protein [Chloroflexaceae bacterium]|nr:choice-of-anchor D domain-containing protein [Chloroflexaceae bacterium]